MEFELSYNKIVANQISNGVEFRLVSDKMNLYKGVIVEDSLSEKSMEPDEFQNYINTLLKKKKMRVIEGEESISIVVEKLFGIKKWRVVLDRAVLSKDEILLEKVETFVSKAITGWVILTPAENHAYDGWKYKFVADKPVISEFSKRFFEAIRDSYVLSDPNNRKHVSKVSTFEELRECMRKDKNSYSCLASYTNPSTILPTFGVIKHKDIYLRGNMKGTYVYHLTFPNVIVNIEDDDILLKTIENNRVDKIEHWYDREPYNNQTLKGYFIYFK